MTDHNWRIGQKPDHAGRPPWLTLVVLSVVFFLVYHDFWHAKVGAGEYDTSAQDLLTNLGAGTFVRTIALSLAGLVAVVSLAYRRSFLRFRFMSAFGWALLFFVALVFLSPLWAVDLSLTFKKILEFGILGSIAIAVVSRFAQREIFLWTFFTTAGYLVLGIFAELFFGTFKPWISEYRFSGTLHPNSSGLECVLLIISAMVAADMEKRWRTPLRLGALLGLIFLVLTGSRTSLAALVLAVVTYLALVSSRRTAIALTVVVSGLLCLLLAVATFGSLSDLENSLMRGRQDPLKSD
jgi:exopolysaccharide production protein ExoQ